MKSVAEKRCKTMGRTCPSSIEISPSHLPFVTGICGHGFAGQKPACPRTDLAIGGVVGWGQDRTGVAVSGVAGAPPWVPRTRRWDGAIIWRSSRELNRNQILRGGDKFSGGWLAEWMWEAWKMWGLNMAADPIFLDERNRPSRFLSTPLIHMEAVVGLVCKFFFLLSSSIMLCLQALGSSA